MNKIKLYFLSFGILLILSACSAKPDNISQEFWDKSVQYTLYADKLTQEGEPLPEGFASELTDIASNKDENKIVIDVNLLAIASLINSMKQTEESKADYDDSYNKLKETFGSDLKSSKLDVELVEDYINENQSISKKNEQDADNDFMATNSVNLTGKEVQYDLSNNLDEEFYLNGNVELCDYYNYGFTNEKDLFCGKLTPVDGKYSDSWYLYFSRESFSTVYQSLLDGNVDMRLVAKINSRSYQRGQGNMARVMKLQMY